MAIFDYCIRKHARALGIFVEKQENTKLYKLSSGSTIFLKFFDTRVCVKQSKIPLVSESLAKF